MTATTDGAQGSGAFLPLPDGTVLPVTVCLVEGCMETEDLDVFECAPGYTYVFTGGICNHVVWLYRKLED